MTTWCARKHSSRVAKGSAFSARVCGPAPARRAAMALASALRLGVPRFSRVHGVLECTATLECALDACLVRARLRTGRQRSCAFARTPRSGRRGVLAFRRRGSFWAGTACLCRAAPAAGAGAGAGAGTPGLGRTNGVCAVPRQRARSVQRRVRPLDLRLPAPAGFSSTVRSRSSRLRGARTRATELAHKANLLLPTQDCLDRRACTHLRVTARDERA